MSNWNRKMHARIPGTAAAVALALALTACGGGSDDLDNLTVVATTDLTAPASAATTSAVVGEPFVFSSGVPELGTASATTLTFTGASATTPAFRIEATEGTATGTTEFGSCIFRVVTSTFPAGHRLAVGQTYRIEICAIRFPTIGVPIATTFSLPVTFNLGSVLSTPRTIPVVIQANGTVQVNGNPVGQTSVGGATGATGGGS